MTLDSSTRLLRALVGTAVLLVLLSACTVGAPSLRAAAEDLPAVSHVGVIEADGDADLPFTSPARNVVVTMRGTATVDEVAAVFDAYDDVIADGDVVGVGVVLEGPRRATLDAGEGVLVDRAAVQDLVRAQGEAGVTSYLREAHPVLPSVEVELDDAALADLLAVADRYADVDDLESVSVSSGRLSVNREDGSSDLRVAARERLALLLERRFGLLAAVVSGQGPLRVEVGGDVAAARRLTTRVATTQPVGRVVVRGSRDDG